MLSFITTNNLEGCCRALLREAALNGCSDLVERTLMMYPAEVFKTDINDDLIDEMFYTCGVLTCENKKQVDRYTGYVDCLNFIITKMAPRNDETIIDVCQIFQQRDIQVIAEVIRENRLDIVERMFRNHDFRHFSTNNCLYFHNTTSHDSRINLMCCAISCADYGMVELLTGKGMDISTSVCCRNKETFVDSFPPLICGLTGLLKLNDEVYETVDESKVLENIKSIVKDFARNFTGTTQSPRDSQEMWRRSSIPSHKTETSRTITVLDIIIFQF